MKKYLKPKIKVSELNSTNILTSSTGTGCSCGCCWSDPSHGTCHCNNGNGCPGNNYNGNGSEWYENLYH